MWRKPPCFSPRVAAATSRIGIQPQPVEALERKWVPEQKSTTSEGAVTCVAGSRTTQAFGAGNQIGHWGGRYIWQLADSRQFRMAWKGCSNDQPPADLEATLVARFKQTHGHLPFANISDPGSGGPAVVTGGGKEHVRQSLD
jgi:hypothetical protein